jgi:VWFA-related protein
MQTRRICGAIRCCLQGVWDHGSRPTPGPLLVGIADVALALAAGAVSWAVARDIGRVRPVEVLRNTLRLGIFWCALVMAIGSAQVLQKDATPPLFRTAAHIVEVSLLATRSNGSTVEDLTAADLRIFDNNREQIILTFERVRNGLASANPPGQTKRVGPRPQRLSMLLLDALNTDFSDQVYAHRAAAGALEQIPAGDRVAIFALGDTLRLLHDFTSDIASLRALVQRFSGQMPRDQLASPATSYSAEFSYSDLLRPKEPGSGPWAAFRQRQRILQTLEALSAIAGLVRNVPGQKNLLWLSAAFPLHINASEPSGRKGFETESFQDEASRTTRALNAANVTIYPIDARGLTVSPRAYINIETMQELAEQTGGKAYYNSNDLASMVRSALADSREAYILTYAPSELQDDGSFHRIRLRTDRHGIQLRYRPGYYADTRPALRR